MKDLLTLQNQTSDLQRFGGLILLFIVDASALIYIGILILLVLIGAEQYCKNRKALLYQNLIKHYENLSKYKTKKIHLQEILNIPLFSKEKRIYLNKNFLKLEKISFFQINSKFFHKQSDRFSGFLLVLESDIELNHTLLFKPKNLAEKKSISKFLNPLIYAQNNLKILNADNQKWGDYFIALSEKECSLDHNLIQKFMEQILILNEELKDLALDQELDKNNRNFKSLFQIHTSPMEISFSNKKITIAIKEYQLFPTSCLFSLYKKHRQINDFINLIKPFKSF